MSKDNQQLSLLEEKVIEDMTVRAYDKASEKEKACANELDGKTWTKYSISIWSNIRKSPDELALKHPAIFPVELIKRLIAIFTNQHDRVVLDPFAGVGSTIVATQQLGKEGIGIELSPEFAEKANSRLNQSDMFSNGEGKGVIHMANALDILEYVNEESIDFVVTSPPYWNILNRKRTADYKEIKNYGDEEADLGKIEDYDDFLQQLKKVFARVYKALRSGAYCCLIVMDIRKKAKFYPFHSDIANFMQEIGFIYDDIIIWDRRHEYNNMRPLGYPYVFRINKAHEFILIFQKPKEIE